MRDVHVCPRRRGEHQHAVGRKFAQFGQSQDGLRAWPISVHAVSMSFSRLATRYSVAYVVQFTSLSIVNIHFDRLILVDHSPEALAELSFLPRAIIGLRILI